MMNRDEFLKRCEEADLKTIEVETDRFGVLRFKQLDNFQKVERWDEVIAPRGKVNQEMIRRSSAVAIVATLVDENGDRMLRVSDIDRVSKLFAGELDKLTEVAKYCVGLDGTNEPEIVKKKLKDSSETIEESAN